MATLWVGVGGDSIVITSTFHTGGALRVVRLTVPRPLGRDWIEYRIDEAAGPIQLRELHDRWVVR